MANLTTKELTALSDQLNFEKTLYCKYQEAAQECTEEDLSPAFSSMPISTGRTMIVCLAT